MYILRSMDDPRRSTSTLSYAPVRLPARFIARDLLIARALVPFVAFWPWTMLVFAGHGVGPGVLFALANPPLGIALLAQLGSAFIAAIAITRPVIYTALAVPLIVGLCVGGFFIAASEIDLFLNFISGVFAGVAGASVTSAVSVLAWWLRRAQ